MPERLDVLRLGYRKGRDPRITTHLGLVSRAFGADGFFLSGDEDKELFSNLGSVSDRFGGKLDCNHVSGMSYLRKHVENGGVAIHLTMYGEPFREAIPKIRRDKSVLIIVGGAKVPGDVYKLCQHNVAVGNQPHSEVAALALFMDAWFGEAASVRQFEDARLVIEGVNNGKVVHDLSDDTK
ncbi:MAG: tRNA (cytidine(56)-2'-O)-methyltransferase [Candidatus Poseidoniaceae archaeon]|jgi:tRNA (cytidine56-2'-O)-methyltransferase|nr:tRNA (cytidine(56)-2'-O)-methyltransferase [Candidatus Poseidoniaceae archaeon]